LNVTAPSLLPSLPQTGERGKIKTNPSVSPFRKGRKKIKIFLIPLFLKEGCGEILCKKYKEINPPVFHFRKVGHLKKKKFFPLAL